MDGKEQICMHLYILSQVHHLRSHGMKNTNNKCWWGCGENGTLVHCWWECKLVQPLWNTVWSFLKKLKIELLYNPAIPLLGIYPKKNKNNISKRYMHPKVHSSTVYHCQGMEATSVSINRWMDKEDLVHIYNRILLGHKKERNIPICSNMDGLGRYHAKWNKSDMEATRKSIKRCVAKEELVHVQMEY